jgi:hypothetical protein
LNFINDFDIFRSLFSNIFFQPFYIILLILYALPLLIQCHFVVFSIFDYFTFNYFGSSLQVFKQTLELLEILIALVVDLDFILVHLNYPITNIILLLLRLNQLLLFIIILLVVAFIIRYFLVSSLRVVLNFLLNLTIIHSA